MFSSPLLAHNCGFRNVAVGLTKPAYSRETKKKVIASWKIHRESMVLPPLTATSMAQKRFVTMKSIERCTFPLHSVRWPQHLNLLSSSLRSRMWDSERIGEESSGGFASMAREAKKEGGCIMEIDEGKYVTFPARLQTSLRRVLYDEFH